MLIGLDHSIPPISVAVTGARCPVRHLLSLHIFFCHILSLHNCFLVSRNLILGSQRYLTRHLLSLHIFLSSTVPSYFLLVSLVPITQLVPYYSLLVPISAYPVPYYCPIIRDD